MTVAAVQFSIAVSQIFLAIALAAWTVLLVTERRRPRAPAWMLPLLLTLPFAVTKATGFEGFWSSRTRSDGVVHADAPSAGVDPAVVLRSE